MSLVIVVSLGTVECHEKICLRDAQLLQKSGFLMTWHILSSVKVAEWSPFVKEQHTPLTVRSDYYMSICEFSHFSF